MPFLRQLADTLYWGRYYLCDEIRVFLFSFEKAVEEVLLALAEFRVRHAFHIPLDSGAGRNGEVVEFVDGAWPLGVLAEPFVQGRDLANLIISVPD